MTFQIVRAQRRLRERGLYSVGRAYYDYVVSLRIPDARPPKWVSMPRRPQFTDQAQLHEAAAIELDRDAERVRDAFRWLRVSLLIRSILWTTFDETTWATAKTVLARAQAMQSRLTREG